MIGRSLITASAAMPKRKTLDAFFPVLAGPSKKPEVLTVSPTTGAETGAKVPWPPGSRLIRAVPALARGCAHLLTCRVRRFWCPRRLQQRVPAVLSS